MKLAGILKQSSFLFLMTVVGCGREYCPAFPNEKRDWFPYSIDDTIRLINNSDTIKLVVSDAGFSDSYSFSKRCKCACEESMFFKTSLDTGNMTSLNASITYGNDIQSELPPPVSIGFVIYKFDNKLNMMTPLTEDRFECDQYSGYDFQESATIDGKIYSNVVSIMNSSNYRFSKIVIAKGFGILEVVDKESGVWIRKNR